MSSTATSRVTLQLPVWQTARFKLLGLIPLAFFLARLVDYWRWDTLAHIWWNCHVANLTLAIGIFLGNLLLMRLAVLWLILGLPPWLIDMLSSGIVWPVSVLTHLGGAVLGLLVAYRVRMTRGVWWAALIWFLVLQQLSRYLTPLEYNVNVAYHSYGATKAWFSSYWQYWLVNSALTAIVLWLLEWVLAKLFRVQPRQ